MAALIGGLIGGLAGGIGGIGSAIFSHQARRSQRRMAKARLEESMARLQRQKEGFLEGSELQRLGAVHGLASRGLSQSSIADQNLSRLSRARARGLADITGQERMQEMGYDAFKQQLKAQQWGDIFSLVSGIGGAAAGVASVWPSSSGYEPTPGPSGRSRRVGGGQYQVDTGTMLW